MAEELSKVLTRLLRDILNTVKNAKDSGKIRKVERLWVHQKIMNFEYNKGLTGFSSLQERVIKKEWDERDKFQVIKKIMELPSYEEACRRVSEVYDIEESRAKYFVERFINYIVNNALNENVGEETLSETITTFINDLEGNPVIWEVVVEIDGLWLKDEIGRAHV